MNIEYCFSSPDGDIPLSPKNLEIPFKISPYKEHPHLLLLDYFKTLEEFILKHNRKRVSELIRASKIEKIIIRSEKHGVLYHIASVDLIFGDEIKRFGLCSAVSEIGKSNLAHEFETISNLNRGSHLPFLPQVFAITEVTPSYGEQRNTILIALMEWLENYHEWHLHKGKGGQKQQIIIWDQQRGYRFASNQERDDIFKEVAKILTLYYDPVTYRQVYPWHNAAGDFIVKTGNPTEVKLTTVRGYEPITDFWKTGKMTPTIAAVYFFLNLTVRMRLDRQEGTGELIWAEEQFLRPVINGFLEGLVIKENKGNSEEINKIPDLLKSFNSDELEKLLYSLLPIYEKEDLEEFTIIKNNLTTHAIELYRSLKSNTRQF